MRNLDAMSFFVTKYAKQTLIFWAQVRSNKNDKHYSRYSMNHCAIHLVQIVMYVVCVVGQISACQSANVCLASVDCCGYQWILEIDYRYSNVVLTVC